MHLKKKTHPTLESRNLQQHKLKLNTAVLSLRAGYKSSAPLSKIETVNHESEAAASPSPPSWNPPPISK